MIAAAVAFAVSALGQVCTPRGLGNASHECSNQVQERLMLRILSRTTEKCADIDVGHLTARRDVRFMPDKHVPGSGIAAQKPSIPVGAAVKLSSG